ncbi:MAG: AMP-binding protein [Alphaproteobacteria bacterium]
MRLPDREDIVQTGLENAAALHDLLARKITELDFANLTEAKQHEAMQALWHEMRLHIIKPNWPKAGKTLLYDAIFAGWNHQNYGYPMLWQADANAYTNIHQSLGEFRFTGYKQLYDWSITDSRAFWCHALQRLNLNFHNGYPLTPYSLCKGEDPLAPQWLPGALFNPAEWALKNNEPEAVAIIWRGDENSAIEYYNFEFLDRESNKIANALQNHGIKKGDFIGMDIPMHPTSLAILYGIWKIGAVAVGFTPGFKPAELALRLEQLNPLPQLIFTQDFYKGSRGEALYQHIAALPQAPDCIVLAQQEELSLLRPQDKSLSEFIAGSSEKFQACSITEQDMVAVIFSSSTSMGLEQDEKPKAPKAIPWYPSTLLKAAVDGHFHQNLGQGKSLCWPTEWGWMMSFWGVVAAHFNGSAYALYGGAVTRKGFGRFIEEAKINVVGLVPAIADAWNNGDVMRGLDFSSVECFSSSGSPSNSASYFYLMSLVEGFVPVIEYMGGTEIGGAYISNSLLQPAAPTLFSTPTLGTNICQPRHEHNIVDYAEGEVAIVISVKGKSLPPMGLSRHLLNYSHQEKYPHRFQTANGDILREHGDILHVFPHGYYQSAGRADNAININGIKTSSTAMEAMLLADKTIREIVEELAVIGVDKSSRAVIVVKAKELLPDNFLQLCLAALRKADASLAHIAAIDERPNGLARTPNGKIRHKLMAEEWEKKNVKG